MDFKKLSEVTQVTEAADTANVLIEEDGVVKRVPKSEVGGSSKLTIEFIKHSEGTTSELNLYLGEDVVYNKTFDGCPNNGYDGFHYLSVEDDLSTVWDYIWNNLGNVIYVFNDLLNTDVYTCIPSVTMFDGSNGEVRGKTIYVTAFDENGNQGVAIYYTED